MITEKTKMYIARRREIEENFKVMYVLCGLSEAVDYLEMKEESGELSEYDSEKIYNKLGEFDGFNITESQIDSIKKKVLAMFA